jgi:acyl-CoA reductase-like NAD-dependent aldehyde dehydrogenase
MFALNQGEVCTCPSRALVHESIFDRFMERSVARTKKVTQGIPLDPATMLGAQVSNDQRPRDRGGVRFRPPWPLRSATWCSVCGSRRPRRR